MIDLKYVIRRKMSSVKTKLAVKPNIHSFTHWTQPKNSELFRNVRDCREHIAVSFQPAEPRRWILSMSAFWNIASHVGSQDRELYTHFLDLVTVNIFRIDSLISLGWKGISVASWIRRYILRPLKN